MATKTDKKPAARAKRSKSETQTEFDVIEAEYAASGPAAARDIETAHARTEDVLARLEGVSVETVVRRIADLGLDVSRALAEVAEKLKIGRASCRERV